jgi:hypothetical protein
MVVLWGSPRLAYAAALAAGPVGVGERRAATSARASQCAKAAIAAGGLVPCGRACISSRVGDLRVFYEVAGTDAGVVRILAVGRKRRNLLTIGGKEIRL